jgi:hypothetical protein
MAFERRVRSLPANGGITDSRTDGHIAAIDFKCSTDEAVDWVAKISQQ